jgi:type IV pilus assembly protein PilE
MNGLGSKGHGASLRLRRSGFTLIEMLITVAILAILAGVAIPQYTGYVTRAKRAEAKRALSEAAQVLERNYTVSGCYNRASAADCPTQSGSAIDLPAVLRRAPAEGKGSYLVSVTFAASGQSFSLQAIPCGSGNTCAAFTHDNFTDTECGSFTLDNTGLRGITGTGTMAACWQR